MRYIHLFLLAILVLSIASGNVYSEEKASKASANIKLKNGLIIKKDTTYYLYPNKSYSRFIIAENYPLPTTMVAKAGTEISFYENKNMYNSLKYRLLYVLHLLAHLLHLGLDADHQGGHLGVAGF